MLLLLLPPIVHNHLLSLDFERLFKCNLLIPLYHIHLHVIVRVILLFVLVKLCQCNHHCLKKVLLKERDRERDSERESTLYTVLFPDSFSLQFILLHSIPSLQFRLLIHSVDIQVFPK